MDVIVATLTQHRRRVWLDEACASVPAGFKHHVVAATNDFQRDRWTLAHAAEYVAWLDDDDRLVPGGLEACIAALDADPTLGVAFTREARIDENGVRIAEEAFRARSRRDIAMHPRELHHLAVIRRSALSDECFCHATEIGCGIDWLMRAEAALRYGAVQVSAIGYEWRDHADTLTRRPADASRYESAIPSLRRVTHAWMQYDAPIRRAKAS